MKRNNAAFTLIEILVTTVIASIISVALFSAFSNGIRLWRRVNTRVAAEQFTLFCERFNADLRGSFAFAAIPFAGSGKDLKFCGLIALPGQPLKGIGRLTYAFDGDGVTRAIDDYAAVYADRDRAGRTVLADLKEFSMEYYFFDILKKEFRWTAEWAEQGLPLAVRVRGEFKDGRAFTRTFTVPAGGRGP